jgi:hypothetical protein
MINKDGKSPIAERKDPIYVGGKAAEKAIIATGRQKKVALKKLCKSCK